MPLQTGLDVPLPVWLLAWAPHMLRAHCQSHHVCLGKSWQAALAMRRPSTFAQSSENGSQPLKKQKGHTPSANACAHDRKHQREKKAQQNKVPKETLLNATLSENTPAP